MTSRGIAPLEAFLRETIGLASDSIGRAAVERAAGRRMAEAGCATAAAYVELLRADEAARQRLVEDLVVPETWFFRDRQPFRLLAKLAVERGGAIRVLSLPCSTGEEPYSIAMTLLDAGLAPDAFAIDAVDISEAALAAARRASYGSNSFRGDHGEARDKWFGHADGRWTPVARVRERVTFHRANLFAFPPAARYDFVFCRNVLIYFDAPTQSAAVRRLLEWLAEDGVLFTGHAEAAVMLREGLAPRAESRTFAFMRRPASGKAAPSPRPRARAVAPRPAVPAPRPFADVAPRREAVPAKTSAVRSLDDIRALADQGELAAAAREARSFIAAHGPSAGAFHLLAITLDAAGDAAGAEAAYRKALYLEPRHEEALPHLVLLLEKRGDPEAARLRRRMARQIAQGGDA